LLDRKREYEAYLSAEAEKMLAAVLGPGKAIVRVTVDFNTQTLTEKTETYNLDQKPIRRSETVNEKSTGSSGQPRGPAGTTSNLGRGTGVASTTSTEQRETETTEYYPPPKTEITRVQALGQIERMTVAVMVDLSQPAANKPPIQLNDVQEIVKQAVGFKTGRDEIKVTEVTLQPQQLAPLDQEWLEAQKWQYYLSLAKQLSLGLVALAGLAFAWLVLRAVKSTARATPEVPAGMSELAKHQPEVLAKVIARWLEAEGTTAAKASAAPSRSGTAAPTQPMRAAA
jgi:flagellar M-ring protein FliF